MEKQKFLVGETVWWFYEDLDYAVNDAQLDDALDLNKYISHGRIHVCELKPDWEHLLYKLISPRGLFWAHSLWLEQEFLFHTKEEAATALKNAVFTELKHKQGEKLRNSANKRR